jgi:hypothetical protein
MNDGVSETEGFNFMSAVQFVTIKSLRTLYKNGEPAERIELANVEEHAFDIVVQKGLYNIGDKVLYVQPDYCLPLPIDGQPNSKAVQLFLDFTMPHGEANKSKLGKNGRIRAIKFNFQAEGSSDPIYSMGVLMPLNMIEEVFEDFAEDISNEFISENDFEQIFEVTKYEESETAHSGMAKGGLPVGMYATDETNIKNLTRIEFPLFLTGTLKVDGSSITIYYKDEEHNGICSRNLEKKLDQTQIVGYTTIDGKRIRKHYDKTANVKGWMQEADNFPEGYIGAFYTVPDSSWIPITEEIDDTFVKLGKPILEKLKAYCIKNECQIALRGELCGTGLKGSGNKNNPHSKLSQQIIFFAVDDYETGTTRRMSLDDFYDICYILELNYAPIIFNRLFNSIEDLTKSCNEYFKDNLIEGIVVKTPNANFSAKCMNPEYDSKKE